jgi:HCO3- transporter family
LGIGCNLRVSLILSFFHSLVCTDGITIHLMNHPCHRLTHGTAYNYDTLIVGLIIGVNSILGLPWLVAATVRSLNHLHALAEKSPDGKLIYSVHETRLTALFAHIFILGSLFVLEVIRLVPVPVLYVSCCCGKNDIGC